MPAPGWYRDPDDADGERRWDGSGWTQERRRSDGSGRGASSLWDAAAPGAPTSAPMVPPTPPPAVTPSAASAEASSRGTTLPPPAERTGSRPALTPPGQQPSDDPRTRPFRHAVSRGLTNWRTLQGRASRSEFWYFFLFVQVISLLGAALHEGLGFLTLALYVPLFSVAVRRLHDIGRSGWSLLWAILPWIGAILILVWFVRRGSPGENPYG